MALLKNFIIFLSGVVICLSRNQEFIHSTPSLDKARDISLFPSAIVIVLFVKSKDIKLTSLLISVATSCKLSNETTLLIHSGVTITFFILYKLFTFVIIKSSSSISLEYNALILLNNNISSYIKEFFVNTSPLSNLISSSDTLMICRSAGIAS